MSTASALEREIECPPSAILSPTVQESGEAAERGTAIHVFCRSVIAGTPRALALAQVPEGPWRETCEQIDFAVLCGGISSVRAEVAYRLDVGAESARELGLNLGRKYPPRSANEIDGTNDFEGTNFVGRWVVTDIKTGFQLVTLCKDNPQMKFHALVLMLVHDVDEVEARIAYVEVDGTIRFDTHVFTRLELDLFGDVVLERRARIERANALLASGGKLEVRAGSWCRWCPAKISCPRFTALAHAMLGDLRDAHAQWGTLSPAQRAEVYLMAAEAKDLAERVVESMKGIARTEPIALPNGKVLRETSSGVRVVNAPKPERRRRSA